MTHNSEDRATSFDRVAELYDRARPGYPEQLAKDLLRLADMPAEGKILEIGCGTGQATALFAPFGNPITCVERGEALARIAEQNFRAFPKVQIVRSRFEDWQSSAEAFDLIISAQAFHWVERRVAFLKAARLLKKSGGIGLFWNRPDESNAPYRTAFIEAYARHAPHILSSEVDAVLEDWIEFKKGEIETSGLFAPVSVRRYPWSLSYNTQRFLELQGTYSDHLMLSELQRAALFQAIRHEIEVLGGSIVKKYVAVLFFAKRA
jgi:SAM-dependent methyltransferase